LKLRKPLRITFGSLAFISLFAVFGAVGGLEVGTVSLQGGLMRITISLLCFIACVYLAGGFKERTDSYV
jgi:hypothetical protein